MILDSKIKIEKSSYLIGCQKCPMGKVACELGAIVSQHKNMPPVRKALLTCNHYEKAGYLNGPIICNYKHEG